MKNNWYEIRNKRTDALFGVNDRYKNISIAVTVTSDVQYHNTQVMFLTTVNILSRWCSQITLLCPDNSNVIIANGKYTGPLLEVAEKIILENDPHLNLTINPKSGNYDFCIAIGNEPANCNVPYVNIDSNGWIAGCAYNHCVRCKKGILDTTNPLSAAFAACLANAEAFRWAIGNSTDPYVKWYSLDSMEISEMPLDNKSRFKHNLSLGRAHIIGCGAIGSSYTWLLSLTNWSGEITLVDMDKKVELHNTSSSLLFTDAHVISEKTKVKICAEHLKGSNFSVHEFEGEFGEYKYDHHDPQKSADILLSFANDRNIWATLQSLYPPVTFHATTSSSWGVNIGRHIPLKDECIYCTFKGIMKTPIPVCAMVEIPAAGADLDTDDEKPSAILPFLSPAAAILTMVQVYKMYDRQIEKENSLQMNFATSTGNFVTDYFKPRNCPACKDQHESVYTELNKNSLFWFLSSNL